MSLPITDPIIDEINLKTQRCYQCNTCVSGCPVFKVYPEFKPANIARSLFQNKAVPVYHGRPAFWLCSSCLTCEAKCPQDVDITKIFYKLRNWAVEKKFYVPEGIIKEAETMKTGSTATISQSIIDRRFQMGLPELPKPDLLEIDKILEHSNFSKRLEGLITLEEME